MRFPLTLCLLLRLFLFGSAQTPELLTGKWDYHSIRKVNEEEPMSGVLLKIVVGDKSFYRFGKDNKYTLFENNSYVRGKWELSSRNTRLMLTTESGIARTVDIVSITRSTLVLLVDGKAYHTFVKSGSNGAEDVQVLSPPDGTVAASKEQLARHWVITELRDSLENEEINRRMTDFLKGGWVELRSDGMYSRKMVTDEKTGHWKFQNDNRTIIMMDEDGFGSVWNICYVSPSKLILQKPGTSVRHIFTALH
jgi:hypothetical protein